MSFNPLHFECPQSTFFLLWFSTVAFGCAQTKERRTFSNKYVETEYIQPYEDFNSMYPNIKPETRYKDQQQFFEVYFGYRYKAPKKVVKRMDNVEDKIGL